MPRRPRLDFAGFHHVVNRGVARGRIYKTADDRATCKFPQTTNNLS